MIVPNEILFNLRPLSFFEKLRFLRSEPIISFKVKKEAKKTENKKLNSLLSIMTKEQRDAWEKGIREKAMKGIKSERIEPNSTNPNDGVSLS